MSNYESHTIDRDSEQTHQTLYFEFQKPYIPLVDGQAGVQRLRVALWYIHMPSSYDVGITLRPMYLLYSYMEPLRG